MSTFSRLSVLALLAAAVLPAASITSYTITSWDLYYNGISVAGDAPNNINDPMRDDGYDITGTLNLFNSATGQVVVSQPSSDPFALRFTDALITCGQQAGCGPAFLTFDALVNFADTVPADWEGVFGIEGSGTGNGFMNAFVVGSDSLIIGNVSTQGPFNESVLLPAFFSSNGSTVIFSMALQISGLGAGESISLPNSLFEQLGTTSSVPEPGTLAIVGAGLAGAVWFRRRQHS